MRAAACPGDGNNAEPIASINFLDEGFVSTLMAQISVPIGR